MTLLDRIYQLQLRAVAADDEEKLRTRAGDFTSLRDRIQNATANASRVILGRAELQTAGIEQGDFEQNRVSALAVVRELMDTVETLAVDARTDAVRMQVGTLVTFFRNSAKWVADSWADALPSEQPAVDEDLLDALEQGGFDVEAIRLEIERAQTALLTLCNKSLPERGDWKHLQEALAVLNSSGERLRYFVDPVIADVVVRAQGDGVPYEELSLEVVAELRRLGILGKFRVVLR
ncbi:hypothetical protein [Geodermatophilus sp. SYSU D01036]